MRPESVETTRRSAPPEDESTTLMRVRWIARAWWALLPLAASPVMVRGFDSASMHVRDTAYVIAWTAWLLGLVGLVMSREVGYTVVRALAPLVAIAAVVGCISAIVQGDITMLIGSFTVSIVALATHLPIVLQAQLDAASYGAELRFPLKTPTVLWLGPIPLAWACIALGGVAGPLFIAGGHLAAGIAALVVGLPLAALAVRSLHTLSARWLVLVPAGVVVKDPMVLTYPILMPSDHIRAVTAASGAAPDTEIDLRLGAILRSVEIRCTEPTEGMRIKKGRKDTLPVDSDTFLVAPMRPKEFLSEYAQRQRR